MKKLLTSAIAIIILCAAYIYTFGTPAWLAFNEEVEVGQADVNQRSNGSGRSSGRGGGRGQRATVVSVGEITVAPFNDLLRAIGTGDALKSVKVVANVSGKVNEINLVANSTVNAGDILVQLDNKTEKINLEIAETKLSEAQNQVDRYEKLGAAATLAVSAVAVQEAKFALTQAKLQVELSKTALEDRTISAPISGVLGLSDIDKGAYLSTGTTVVTVDDIDDILVEFELPERALGFLSKGRDVRLSTPAIFGKVFIGKIFAYDNRIDSTTRTITVQVRVDNSEHLLLPGMSFSVRLDNKSKPLNVVPSSAISWSREGSQIWTVDGENKVQSHITTIVMRQGDQIWIDATLEAGTMVVTEGAQKLRNGMTITPANAEPAAAKNTARKRTGDQKPDDVKSNDALEKGAEQAGASK